MAQQDATSGLKLYLAGIYFVGASLGALCLTTPGNDFTFQWGLLTTAVLFVSTVGLRLPKTDSAIISMGDVFTILALIEFGAGPALVTYWVQIISASLASGIRSYGSQVLRQIRPSKLLFNLAQCAISVWGMHLAYGWAASLNVPATTSTLIGLGAIASVWFVINTGTLSAAIALSTQQPFLTIWNDGKFLALLNSYGSAAAAGLIALFYERSFFVFLLALPIAAVFYQLYSFYIDRYDRAKKHIAELNKLYLQTVEVLATAVDAKDRYTHGHIRRVQAYAVELAVRMGISDEKELMAIRSGALLHDIGKIAIPEYILNKPTVLTEAEFEKMKTHPSVGATMLQGIEFPFPVEPLVKSHHERWDGKGYPDGLRGEEIPLSARILSLIDCFDALTTNRPYRSPMDRNEVIEFFRRESGRSYDPGVVDAFVAHIEALEAAGAKIEVASLDLWGGESGKETANVRPLEKVQPTLTYSKAMDVSAEVQIELYSLFEFVRSVHALRVNDILAFVGMKLERLIKFDAAVFYLLDAEQEAIVASHVVGPAAHLVAKGLAIPLDQKLSGWVAANNQALSNLPPFPDFIHVPDPKPQFQVSAIAPMTQEGSIVGSLSLYRLQGGGKFTDQEFRHLEIVAGQAAVALHRALSQESGQEALFDDLTELPNGYQMYLMFDQVAMDAERYAYPLALFAFQVEGLAEIRRSYGHLSANEVVRSMAKYLKSSVRDTDILVRYSEDQFLSLHPRMDRAQAEAFRTRIQDELDRERVSVRPGVEVALRASVGLTEFPEEGTRLEDLLSLTEWRLDYDSKLRSAARRTVQFPS